MADLLTDEREDRLISLFEDHPCLYDLTQKAYSNKYTKGNALRSIGEALASNTEEVNKKIHSLRKQYNRYIKLPASGSAGRRTARQHFILRRLSFLRPFLKKRTSVSNFEEKEDDTINVERDDEEEEEEGLEDPQSVPGPLPRPLPGPKRAKVQPEHALMNTVDNLIKTYTEQHQSEKQPDDIKAFCLNLEQKMRRIEDDDIRFELERQVEELGNEALMRDQARQAYVGPSSSSQFQPYYQQL